MSALLSSMLWAEHGKTLSCREIWAGSACLSHIQTWFRWLLASLRRSPNADPHRRSPAPRSPPQPIEVMLAGRLCRAGAKLHDTIIDSMEMDSGGHLRWNLWLALPPSACCNTGPWFFQWRLGPVPS